MNYTEMESKVVIHMSMDQDNAQGQLQVREATNNEPWGASSTLMQEIANATHS